MTKEQILLNMMVRNHVFEKVKALEEVIEANNTVGNNKVEQEQHL